MGGGGKEFGKLTRKYLFWCPDSHDLYARIVSGVSGKDTLNVSPHTKHRATEDMIDVDQPHMCWSYDTCLAWWVEINNDITTIFNT